MNRLPVYTINFARYDVTISEIHQMMATRYFMIFLAIVVWTHVVFDKNNLGDFFGFETRTLIWTSVTLAFVVIHYALLRLSFLVIRFAPKWFHFTPLGSLLGILICEPIYIHTMVQLDVFKPFDLQTIFQFIGRDLIVLALLEFIFATVIIPVVTMLPALSHLYRRPKANTVDPLLNEPPTMISFGDNRINAAQILLIQSEDHYCHLLTTGQKYFERRRLIDIIDTIPQSYGMRIHRSYWIAHKHVAGIRREGQKTLVITKDGQAISASRKLRAELLKIYPEING